MYQLARRHRQRLSVREQLALEELGDSMLSDADVLALLIGERKSGLTAAQLAEKILNEYGGWVGLQRLSLKELAHIPGISRSKASQIQAALEIGRRLPLSKLKSNPQIEKPADIANLLVAEMAHLQQEHLRVALLSTKNHVLSIVTVYIGSVNCSQVRVAEVFKEAIRTNAPQIIVIHNHPSGDPTPSPEDVAVTRKIIAMGEELDIDVLDHIVIGQGAWISLRERRLGFTR